jgi:serine/threonine protein kinase
MVTTDPPMDGSLPTLDGKVRLNPHVMKRLLLGRGWTLRDYCKHTDTQMRTAQKVFRKEPIQVSTARFVAEVFDTAMLDIIDVAEYTPAALASDANAELGTGEWAIGKALTPVITIANGLQYRVFAMNHAFEPNRRGRGKRYEFHERNDEDKERTRHAMSRHLSVCEKLAPSSYFPTCYSTFPDQDRDTWWVIDQWIDGPSLAKRLERGPLDAPDVYNVGKQIAEAIVAAHDTDVIIRELTPQSILLRDDSSDIVLTDFELAKLTEDYPTVSADDWPESPYRAPEVGAGEIDRTVDIYAWGRIMSHATLGRLPDRGQEARELKFSMASKGWIELLVACTQLQRSKRPSQTAHVVETICVLQASS